MELNGIELMNLNYGNEEIYIVENLLSIGLTLLGGSPKAGKSLLAMQLGLAVSSGKVFLNHSTYQKDVLYLALEDTMQSFQKRFKKFNHTPNDNLHFIFGNIKNKNNINELIESYKDRYPNLGLVIIDTFAKIRNNEIIHYQEEYAELSSIRDIAINNQISIVLVHHIVKYFDRKNPMRNFLGSQGMIAAVDVMMVLMKDELELRKAKLYIDGKNIESKKIEVINDKNLIWNIDEQSYVEELDIDVAKIINYVYANKKFDGTIGELANRLKINIYPNQLSRKLKIFEQAISSNGISIKRNRTRDQRLISLYLKSNDDVTVIDGHIDEYDR